MTSDEDEMLKHNPYKVGTESHDVFNAAWGASTKAKRNTRAEVEEAFLLPTRAIANLAAHQKQLDMDGCMVGVSGQALDEVLNYVALKSAQHDKLPNGKFKRGDMVRKKGDKGQWHGKIVGEYSTKCTPIGYAVESVYEENSVQIYPEKALEAWEHKPNQLPRIEGWQPIETAPKDGTKILLGYFPGASKDWPDWSSAPESWRCAFWNRTKQKWIEGKTYLSSEGFYSPTHWMPLPQPPKHT